VARRTLKSWFGRGTVERIADAIAAVHPGFARDRFVADATRGLASRELLARGDHVARALSAHLPRDTAEALHVLVASLGPERSEGDEDGLGVAPFLYLPHVAFIRAFGLEAYDASMDAQHALTRRFTAEWSIRPFLEAEPARTLAVLRRWAQDPSPHVRRLVSEGTRPRLPWAPRLRAFAADPSAALALLEALKDDPSEYVRRSVANHLNDVGKDHPALLVETARRWLEGATPERARVVRHALRTLVKRGDRAALALLGHGARPRIAVTAAGVDPARARVGEVVTFRATIASTARTAQRLAVDLAVHFVKASGAARPKVFKGRVLALPAGGEAEVRKRISLAQMSTRRHHAGVHEIDLLVNGVRFPAARFEVVAGAPRRPAKVRKGRPPVSRRAR
jgi:3-methyladenine DNA glycosylase AlkC